jgi:DNA (cytosine-5)-methyltransferase 1
MSQSIPVIDLFAGPGGLGEGFSALRRDGRPVFKIGLSIEKDYFAHQTLELRAFFRKFQDHKTPEEYYLYLTGKISRNDLFTKYPVEAGRARNEAWHAELGSKNFPTALVDERIRQALADRPDWVLIGGPPCQAYSLVGRSRRKNDPEFATDEKHFLYKQYLRILAMRRPAVFVMENVKGILSATVNETGIFQRIIKDLAAPLKGVPEADQSRPLGYKLFSLVTSQANLQGEFEPEDFVVHAEQYGVPQARHRVILLGIRSDWHHPTPGILHPTGNLIPIEKAIGDLPHLRSGLSKEEDTPDNWLIAVSDLKNSPTMLDPSVSPDLRQAIRELFPRLKAGMVRGGEFVPGNPRPKFAWKWLFDPRLQGFCNHITRGHIRGDLHRYLFAALFAQVEKRIPSLEEFPKALLPNHKNVAEALAGSMFNDRFRVQLRGHPSTTITAHISKDGHYFIHYDPAQCRSLTVREAARLQTFRDNYFFEGPRTEQYHQVGNAVPPWLARQIAAVVARLF